MAKSIGTWLGNLSPVQVPEGPSATEVSLSKAPFPTLLPGQMGLIELGEGHSELKTRTERSCAPQSLISIVKHEEQSHPKNPIRRTGMTGSDDGGLV